MRSAKSTKSKAILLAGGLLAGTTSVALALRTGFAAGLTDDAPDLRSALTGRPALGDTRKYAVRSAR